MQMSKEEEMDTISSSKPDTICDEVIKTDAGEAIKIDTVVISEEAIKTELIVISEEEIKTNEAAIISDEHTKSTLHNTDASTTMNNENNDQKKKCDADTFLMPSAPAHNFAKPLGKPAKPVIKSLIKPVKKNLSSKDDNSAVSDKRIDIANNDIIEIKTETELMEVRPKIEEQPKKKSQFPYSEPSWGGVADNAKKYYLTVLKDGTLKDNIELTGKSLITFGRMSEDCDVTVDHPSCSRYHALLQYCVVEKDNRKKGFYLYDMDSTHGTYLNKEKLKAKVYNRVRVGYQIKFGGSSRLYIVEGPEDDQEEELDLDVIREKRRLYQQKMAEQKQKQLGKSNSKQSAITNSEHDKNDADEDDEGDGATWGFGEDAKEEGLDLKELFEKKKDIEVKDPKKTLRGFFDREGIEFDYEMSLRGNNNNVIHVAQVRLPIETSEGTEVIAEGTSSNKKDAVLACALDACRLIQAYDMMQNTTKEDQRLKRQRELEANDFYDSDEDTFLDRTGSVEKKRLKRRKWAGKEEEKVEVETHKTLKLKFDEKEKELAVLQKRLDLSKAVNEVGEDGDVDAYMLSMKNSLDNVTKTRMKRQLLELKKEVEKLRKLVEMTRPTSLPKLTIKKNISTTQKASDETEKESTSGSTNELNGRPTAVINTAPHSSASENNSANQKVETNSMVKKIDEKTSIKTVSSNTHDSTETPPVKKPKKKNKTKSNTSKKASDEKDFVEWLPPENQTGDGRTTLNDKLGY